MPYICVSNVIWGIGESELIVGKLIFILLKTSRPLFCACAHTCRVRSLLFGFGGCNHLWMQLVYTETGWWVLHVQLLTESRHPLIPLICLPIRLGLILGLGNNEVNDGVVRYVWILLVIFLVTSEWRNRRLGWWKKCLCKLKMSTSRMLSADLILASSC
jgi:hypothetical protein